MHHIGGRSVEAKDLPLPDDARGDIGIAMGHRRLAVLGAMGALLAIGLSLVLAITLAMTVWRNRFVAVPIDVSRGLVVAGESGGLLEDSVLYQPTTVIETAKSFLDLRYAYDFRAGAAKILAAATMVERGHGEGAVTPSQDLVDRLDAARTRIELSYDNATVRYLSHGMMEVIVTGQRRLYNVQYTPEQGPRITPYKESVYVQRVQPSPAFPNGLAITGSKGDLDQ